jgi:hypothetical protein
MLLLHFRLKASKKFFEMSQTYERRVGNNAFAIFFQSATTSNRVAHYADIVPHVPQP